MVNVAPGMIVVGDISVCPVDAFGFERDPLQPVIRIELDICCNGRSIIDHGAGGASIDCEVGDAT